MSCNHKYKEEQSNIFHKGDKNYVHCTIYCTKCDDSHEFVVEMGNTDPRKRQGVMDRNEFIRKNIRNNEEYIITEVDGQYGLEIISKS